MDQPTSGRARWYRKDARKASCEFARKGGSSVRISEVGIGVGPDAVLADPSWHSGGTAMLLVRSSEMTEGKSLVACPTS